MADPQKSIDLAEAARLTGPFVQEVRGAIHSSPGLRFTPEEDETLQFIAEKVLVNIQEMDCDFDIVRGDGFSGGLVLDLVIDPALPTRLLRADVDALAVTEKTGLAFASTREGLMHACGHDVHSAMLLGALQAITFRQVVPTTNLRFVWQRAEENPVTESGGAMLVREGVLEGVDTVHGLHVYVDNEIAPGSIGLIPGAMLGNSDRFRVVIKSDGGHAARPNEAINTLQVAAHVIVAFESVGTELLNPFEPRSICPTILHAGTLGANISSNVIPGSTELWFNARQMLNETERAAFHLELTRRVETIAERFRRPGKRLEIEAAPVLGHPALFNDSGVVSNLYQHLTDSGLTVAPHNKSLGGEDFAHYLNGKPGAYAFLGCWQEGTGDFHSSTFNPDPRQFWRGVHYWLAIATM